MGEWVVGSWVLGVGSWWLVLGSWLLVVGSWFLDGLGFSFYKSWVRPVRYSSQGRFFFPKKVLSGFENMVFQSLCWIPLNLRLKNQLAVYESWADSDTTIGFVSKFCAEWCN